MSLPTREGTVPRTLLPGTCVGARREGGDINSDGVMDLLAVQADGIIIRLSDKNEGQAWEIDQIARLNNLKDYILGSIRLSVAISTTTEEMIYC